MKIKIKIGYSTCPNDTFIFDALVNGKIDSEGFDFEPVLTDVEDLNQRAFQGELDVTKLSYHAWLHVWEDYQILDSGSALGKGNGPLLVSGANIKGIDLSGLTIAIPGEFTTANLLLSLAYPMISNKKTLVFSRIEDAILDGEVDAGVLIHENRFTYEKRGLKLIRDLGRFWEETSSQPIPLGGIMAHRRLSFSDRLAINRLIRRSLDHAFMDPRGAIPYIRRFAQTMEEDVLHAHLKTFVNDFSLDLGIDGRQAIRVLAGYAVRSGLISKYPEVMFLDET